METVKQMWEDFASKVLGPHQVDIGEVQYIETRRAFYGGVFSALCLFRKIGEDAVTEESGVEHMEKCWQETLAFYEDMAAGKA